MKNCLLLYGVINVLVGVLSYFSEVSEGGTRTKKRKKRVRDKDGNVIGYGSDEDYSSSSGKC